MPAPQNEGQFIPYDSLEGRLRETLGELVTAVTVSCSESGVQLPEFERQWDEIDFWLSNKGKTLLREAFQLYATTQKVR
jgi:hypothetical protein